MHQNINSIDSEMLKTIRVFANPNFIEKHDNSIKNILSNKFNVLPSCRVYGDVYEFYEEDEHTATDFALFIMHEFLTDREPQTEWFNRMIHPVIDCAKFTYIIIHSLFLDNCDYSSIEKCNNIKIKYAPWIVKSYDEIIKSCIITADS
jgi:hypothetical protein